MIKQAQKYYCSTCGHEFDSAAELLAHKVDGARLEDDLVHCDECDGFFESLDKFRDHLQKTHLRQA
jgi:DNA-directed RNA polymerase subunit RPC12/RpoP